MRAQTRSDHRRRSFQDRWGSPRCLPRVPLAGTLSHKVWSARHMTVKGPIRDRDAEEVIDMAASAGALPGCRRAGDRGAGPRARGADRTRRRRLGRVLGAMGGRRRRSARARATASRWTRCACLPPITETARVFCVAQNYPAHAAEAGGASPPRPAIFLKPPSAFVGHASTVVAACGVQLLRLRGRARRRGGQAGPVDPTRGRATTSSPATRSATTDPPGTSSRRSSPTASRSTGSPPRRSTAARRSGRAWCARSDVPDPERLRIRTTHNGELVQDDVAGSMFHPIARPGRLRLRRRGPAARRRHPDRHAGRGGQGAGRGARRRRHRDRRHRRHRRAEHDVRRLLGPSRQRWRLSATPGIDGRTPSVLL